MTAVNFVYWLQGFFELSDDKTITEHQIECIKKHLSLVFIHEIDPSAGNKPHQDVLNEIHNTSHQNVPGGVVYRC